MSRCQIDENHVREKENHSKCVHVRIRRKGVEKFVISCVRTKWMTRSVALIKLNGGNERNFLFDLSILNAPMMLALESGNQDI